MKRQGRSITTAERLPDRRGLTRRVSFERGGRTKNLRAWGAGPRGERRRIFAKMEEKYDG